MVNSCSRLARTTSNVRSGTSTLTLSSAQAGALCQATRAAWGAARASAERELGPFRQVPCADGELALQAGQDAALGARAPQEQALVRGQRLLHAPHAPRRRQQPPQHRLQAPSCVWASWLSESLQVPSQQQRGLTAPSLHYFNY